MSRIDELIKEKCPGGVEYKTLGETCEIKTGAGITKKDATEDGIYPIISGGIEPLGMYSKANRKANTVTIARAGGAGYVNYITKDFYLNDKCFSVIPNDEFKNCINSRFLYFVLKNIEKDIMDMKSTGSVPTVNTQKISKIKIPVPPLEIQREIVGMLNSFTELEAELTKRRQQYEHYRDRLLSFENLAGEGGQVEWLPLEDVAKIKNGSGYKDFGAGPYPVYGTGGIMTRVDRFAYDRPSVLIPRKGSLDRVYYVEEPFWNVDTIFYTEIDEQKIVPKYFYYFLSSKHLEELNQAAGIPSLTQATLNKIKVPVPPLKIQERMVYVLDNFDAVCNDLNIGLPAEIEARQKQYEYYRDKLLTFEKM